MRSFGPGLVAGNTIFVGGHFLLGFVVGLPAVALIQSAAPLLAVAAFVALAVLGAVGWLIVRRRRRGGAPAAAGDAGGTDYTAWADAACPACVTVALVRRQ